MSKILITLEDYLKGRDKLYPDDYTKEIETNANILLEKVNAFLNELGVEKVEVSSGWRSPSINAGIPNAAKKSLHMTGFAVDLKDDEEGSLDTLVASKPDLMRKYGLFQEHPDNTRFWCHLDCSNFRKDRPSRQFKP